MRNLFRQNWSAGSATHSPKTKVVRPKPKELLRAYNSKGYRAWFAGLLIIGALVTIHEFRPRRRSGPLDGATIFEDRCVTCHRPNSGTRAPLPDQIRKMSRDSILRALESDVMKLQGTERTQAERTAVAEYLGNPAASASQPMAMTGLCFAETAPPPILLATRFGMVGESMLGILAFSLPTLPISARIRFRSSS